MHIALFTLYQGPRVQFLCCVKLVCGVMTLECLKCVVNHILHFLCISAVMGRATRLVTVRPGARTARSSVVVEEVGVEVDIVVAIRETPSVTTVVKWATLLVNAAKMLEPSNPTPAISTKTSCFHSVDGGKEGREMKTLE